MGKKKRKPTGVITEQRLSDFLRAVGVVFSQTDQLNHVFKTDLLIEGMNGLRGSFPPIALQVTQRRGDLEKIRKWMAPALRCTEGPVLYVEIEGKVTISMAFGVKTLLASLWLDGEFQGNTHRVFGAAVDPSGAYTRFSPRKRLKKQGP